MRLLGIRLSSLRNINEIKKDGNLKQFFGGKLSIDEKNIQNQTNLQNVKKEIKTKPVKKAIL